MADAGPSLPRELLDRGDLAFVDAIRQSHDADALAAFAEVWYADLRPDSRRLLFEYLDRPLNAYRHEGLVKRLFKKSEAAGDDEVMARFLVLFDRSVRRVRKFRSERLHDQFGVKQEAHRQAEYWRSLGYRNVSQWGVFGSYHVSGTRRQRVIRPPSRDVMPRGRLIEVTRGASIEDLPKALEKLKKFRLFRMVTRNYLRRRAWRYFRKLGRTQPERYVAAVSQALAIYRDEDMADDLALIDNWGLVHILFHHSPAIEAKSGGWSLKGETLGGLSSSPIYERLWDESPQHVVGLLSTARSKAVRRWAIHRIEADPTTHRPGLPLDGWLDLLGHSDPEVVALAARIVPGLDGLETIHVDRWLTLAELTDPTALEVIGTLIGRHVRADQVTLAQAVKLASSRALPVAKVGLAWLKSRSVSDPALILGLIEAQCVRLRPEILGWLRATLAASPDASPGLILDFLDDRRADVRAEGWEWFQSDLRAFEDVEIWRKLIESPYDDIRIKVVTELESRIKLAFEPDDLRMLWASVLLNIHRGSQVKPMVVRQLLARLKANPNQAPALLPLLSIALRSVRGPERRAGLVAIVQLLETRAEVEPLVRSTFPELQWIAGSSQGS